MTTIKAPAPSGGPSLVLGGRESRPRSEQVIDAVLRVRHPYRFQGDWRSRIREGIETHATTARWIAEWEEDACTIIDVVEEALLESSTTVWRLSYFVHDEWHRHSVARSSEAALAALAELREKNGSAIPWKVIRETTLTVEEDW